MCFPYESHPSQSSAEGAASVGDAIIGPGKAKHTSAADDEPAAIVVDATKCTFVEDCDENELETRLTGTVRESHDDGEATFELEPPSLFLSKGSSAGIDTSVADEIANAGSPIPVVLRFHNGVPEKVGKGCVVGEIAPFNGEK